MNGAHPGWQTVAAAVLAFAIASPRSSTADPIPARALRQNLFAACFVSESEGWAVGDLGRIFHTADGARTWMRQDAKTKRPFVALACPDRDHLWAAGQAGEVARSTDAGETWTMLPTGTDRMLLDIAFADAQRGLAIGDFGLMIRTEDGGDHWTKVALPSDTKLPPDIAEVVAPGDVLLYSASFADRDHVWVAGEFGVILASSDGGATWRPQNSPVETTLFGVFFADPQRGWAVGLESTLLATADGGETWTKQPVESPPGFFLALYDIQVRGKYGWAVGSSGFLLNSSDSGATWNLVRVPVQMRGNWLRGISLLGGGKGFMVGETGSVLEARNAEFVQLKRDL